MVLGDRRWKLPFDSAQGDRRCYIEIRLNAL